MRLLLIVAVLAGLTALADKPTKPYVPPGLAKVPPGLAKKKPTFPEPPMPFSGPSPKLHATSVSVPVSGIADPTSPNYGAAYKFNASYEGGKTNIGVYVQWNNWPVATPYLIQMSTNLVDWTDVALSAGDAGRVVVLFELDPKAFYRIQKAFVTVPVHPTPVP